VTDEELIRWVAQAQIGDALPQDISKFEIYDRLHALGAPLQRGMSDQVNAPIAMAWAKEWVEQHQ
jgi:hypothetical protein